MFPCVCSVIDHRWRQNVVRTKKRHTRRQPIVSLMFLPHFVVISDLLLNRRTATCFFLQRALLELRCVLKMDALEMDIEEISTWRHEFIRFCRNSTLVRIFYCNQSEACGCKIQQPFAIRANIKLETNRKTL